jgi:hypothetical protein
VPGFGSGGPIAVVRALAVAGRTVRVVFNESPVFRSAAAVNDALNPANFIFSIDAGIATSPVATGVLPTLVVGPARGVGNGSALGVSDERGVDVGVDRALIVGITYHVTAQSIQSAFGGSLGAANNAAFPGVVPLQVVPTRATGSPSTNVDLFNRQFVGSWQVDDSGDIATQNAQDGYRKRILRRLTTFQNAYSFLKGYGLPIKLKEVSSLRQIAALKADAEKQIRQEPETDDVQVTTSLVAYPQGLLTIAVKARTKQGAFVEAGLKVGQDGSFQTF